MIQRGVARRVCTVFYGMEASSCGVASVVCMKNVFMALTSFNSSGTGTLGFACICNLENVCHNLLKFFLPFSS